MAATSAGDAGSSWTVRRTLVILLFAALAAVPAPALASRSQQSVFEDETSLLYSGPARRDQTLDELRGLGVDVIRANVIWNRYVPSPGSKSRPSFDASDPNAYSLGEVDALVAGASARGMTVLLTPTGPGPAWASSCGGSASARRICNPKASEYGRFVTALGRRYPAVTHWSIWNEPNQGGWLTPQWKASGRSHIPAAPAIYRNLVRAATSALAATGHGSDQILLGETAPIGRTSGSYAKRSLAPADFYRELFCLDARGRKLTGKAARVRGCSSFKRLAVTGVAHHPYTRGAGQSLARRVGPGDITLANISRLSKWLDRGGRRGRVPRGLPIWITEFGFQTNPPDRYAGTSLGNQARWLNQSDWLAWRNSRIRSVAQYEMRDERSSGAFQTGLRFLSGKAKPALAAYRLPIWALTSGSSTKVWLQVRPQAHISEPQKVSVQYLPRGKRSWRTAGTYTVDSHGFLYRRIARRAAHWRFVWDGKASRSAAP
jgi:hypothetical protein